MFRIVSIASLGIVAFALGCSTRGNDDDDHANSAAGAAGSGSGKNVTNAGSSGADGTGSHRSGTAGNGSDKTGTAGNSGATAGSSAGGSGNTRPTDDGNDDANVGGACTQARSDAHPSPAILQFVIDKSTSMNDEAPSTNGASKWQATVQALVSSYAEMNPSLAVGESFFPSTEDGCVDESGGVPIAPLTTDQVEALQAGAEAIPDPTDIRGTPTHDAWREGLRRLEETLADPPAGYETAQGYVVLMTDGMPVKTLGCGEAAGDNIAVTEEQFNELIDDVEATTASSGINTFVIGVPGSENTDQVPSDGNGELDYIPRTKLSELAVAGRTARNGCSNDGPLYCHLDMVQESDFVAVFESAIGTVFESIVSCTFTVPTLDIPNVFVDPDQATVNYYADGAKTPTVLSESTDDCDSGDWQYNEDQTQLQLCDATCKAVQADATARIEVDFGCLVPQ